LSDLWCFRHRNNIGWEVYSLDTNNYQAEEQAKMVTLLTKTLPHFRANLRLSQKALGDKIGVSRQTISSIERGEYRMPWSIFLAITYFLKVNNGAISQENMTDADRFLLIIKHKTGAVNHDCHSN